MSRTSAEEDKFSLWKKPSVTKMDILVSDPSLIGEAGIEEFFIPLLLMDCTWFFWFINIFVVGYLFPRRVSAQLQNYFDSISRRTRRVLAHINAFKYINHHPLFIDKKRIIFE